MTDRRHVLVARLDNAGDVLLSGPLVRAVAARNRVTYLAGPAGAAAAALLPGVGEVEVAEAGWIQPAAPPPTRDRVLDLVDRLAAMELDEAVVATSFHQSALPLALILRMAGVERIGAISEDFPGSLLDIRHNVNADVHEVQRALSLGAAMGHTLPAGDDRRLAVVLPPHAAPPPATPASPYVVVHPGASVPARAWGADACAAAVGRLVAAGWAVAVTGAAGELALTAAVSAAGAVDLGGATDLAGLATVLAGAAAVVVGNTGPAHLAAAVGTPVVSLYAPTVPAARWRPWGVPHVLLGDQDIACAGCRARDCPVAGHPCLGSVGPDEVVAAVAAVARLRAGSGRP